MASILKISLTANHFANLESGVLLDKNNLVKLTTDSENKPICPISIERLQEGQHCYIIINCRCKRIKTVFSNALLGWIEINPTCPVCNTRIQRDVADLNPHLSLTQRIKDISLTVLAYVSVITTRALIGPKLLICTMLPLTIGYGAACGILCTTLVVIRSTNGENPEQLKKTMKIGFVMGASFGLIGAACIISAIEVPFQMLLALKSYLY